MNKATKKLSESTLEDDIKYIAFLCDEKGGPTVVGICFDGGKAKVVAKFKDSQKLKALNFDHEEYLEDSFEDERLKFSENCIISTKSKGISDNTNVKNVPWSLLKKDHYEEHNSEWCDNLNTNQKILLMKLREAQQA